MAHDVRSARVIFLFGAGASADADVPTTNRITEILLNYGRYVPSPDSTTIENLLKYIQVRIADHLQVPASTVNFEMVLGAVIELSLRAVYPVVPLLGEGDALIRKLEATTPLRSLIEKLYSLLRELLTVRKPVDYLHPLSSFIAPGGPLDLFTLNYDLSLEKAFKALKIPFTTGYQQRQDGYEVWTPSEFDQKKFSVRIFKLHGSLDWGEYYATEPPDERAGADWLNARTYLLNYPERLAFSPSPVPPVQPPGEQRGMVSVMNFGVRKERLYASTQFTVLFHHFLQALREARTCVIAGYSFSDDTINKIIEEATATQRGALHLVIVNPSAFHLSFQKPVLGALRALNWATFLDKGLGEALRDGSLKAAVEASTQGDLGEATIQQPGPAAASAHAGESGGDQEHETPAEPLPVDFEKVLQNWDLLGRTVDILKFWMAYLWPELARYETLSTDAEAAEAARLLEPIARKVRDACWQILWVWDETRLDGAYGEELLKEIRVPPEATGTPADLAAVRRQVARLPEAVSYLFNAYHLATPEFTRAVKDETYGARLGGPTHLQVAGLVINKTTSTIYGMAELLDDLYAGAGYRRPFEKLPR